MNSNLMVTSYQPSFRAVTTIKNPAKILSDADFNLLKSLGEKIGNNNTDFITMSFSSHPKAPDKCFITEYAAKIFKPGKSYFTEDKTPVPYAKMSPVEYGKKLMAMFSANANK